LSRKVSGPLATGVGTGRVGTNDWQIGVWALARNPAPEPDCYFAVADLSHVFVTAVIAMDNSARLLQARENLSAGTPRIFSPITAVTRTASTNANAESPMSTLVSTFI